jgi:hypothetical protein
VSRGIESSCEVTRSPLEKQNRCSETASFFKEVIDPLAICGQKIDREHRFEFRASSFAALII